MSASSTARLKKAKAPSLTNAGVIGANNQDIQPYISASANLPEITPKAFILGILLAAFMAASNAYLGLKVGMTVSACIPAAVVSMAILKFFRNSNILENNIVQTAASAGEVLAAGAVFTLPALIMMGYWQHFPFWTTMLILAIGGVLGVLISIPLRRALIVNSPLKFPEGVATAEVLLAGEGATHGGTKQLLLGGIGAALVKMGQSGWHVLSEGVNYWTSVGKTVAGAGAGFSLVLVGAGYIVGIQVGVAMIIGAIIAWVVGVPIYGYLYGLPEGADAHAIAGTIWNSNIRMIGVGAMVVGGLWSLVGLLKPIADAVRSSIEAFKNRHTTTANDTMRTERDIPMTYVLAGTVLMAVPLYLFFYNLVGGQNLPISSGLYIVVVTIITLVALLSGFICSSIAGYMSGLIGSSNNPISGVTIMAVLFASLAIFAVLNSQMSFIAESKESLGAAALAIMIGAIVACASSVGADNLQDLKSGQIVGSTPWKQQVMLLVGVVVGSLAMAPVLDVLYNAYGMGTVFPREGMDPTQTLAAPKAALMSIIAQGVFNQSLDWSMFLIGGAGAVILILIDKVVQRTIPGWGLPVMAVAIGIYMPFEISFAVLIGGLVASWSGSALDRKRATLGIKYAEYAKNAQQRGLLFASGLIAGDALMGILLAIPFAAYQTTDVFRIDMGSFAGVAPYAGALGFITLCYMLYHCSSRSAQKS